MDRDAKKKIIATLLKAERPDLANAVASTKTVVADDWIPHLLDAKEKAVVHGLVSQASKTIKWDIFMAAAIAVELLEDVNAHDEAAAVNRILSKMVMTEVNQKG